MGTPSDRSLADYAEPTHSSWRLIEVPPIRHDRAITGALTSPDFTVDRRYLNFIVKGTLRRYFIRLIVDEQPVYSTSGHTIDQPSRISWNLSDYQGKTARISIQNLPLNQETLPDGIEVRDINLSDQSSLSTLERSLVLTGRYLNLPASHQGLPSTFTLEVDGHVFRTGNFLPTHTGQPDYWVSMDLPQFTGKSIRLIITDAPTESTALDSARTTSQPHGQETLYRERLRPQYHFSSRNGWLNDPNGMVYHRGEYHLFYQHNALGHVIDNQSWGHSVSRDLFHWEERPVVMEPYSFSKGLSFSGSAVIDRQNRAGFGRDAMIAIYTDTSGSAKPHELDQTYPPRGEVLAYSTDDGRTFSYYEGNPVFVHPDPRPQGGRDPKILWWPQSDTDQTDPNGHWVMAVFSQEQGRDIARVLISDDLKNWTETDQVPDHFECIELFELPLLNVHGRPTGQTKWIVQGADGTYHLGDFDGRQFIANQPHKQRTLHLPAYAWQRFNDAPNNRIITIGWIRGNMTGINWQDMPFSQMMTVPLELTLRETGTGLQVFANPVRELEALSREIYRQENISLTSETPLSLPGNGQQFDIQITFQPTPGSRFTIELGTDQVIWENGRINGQCDLPTSPDGFVTIRLLVDRPAIELIGNHGEFYIPLSRKDQGKDFSIRLTGEAQIKLCRLAEIQSAQ